MALITSAAQLNVGVELDIDEAARTFTLNVAGDLVAKDGVNYQALYSKFVNLWNTPTYQDGPMPMRAGNVKAGNYIFGQDDSGRFNGYRPADAATISYLRNGGHEQYDANGNLTAVYSGWVGLGGINAGAQPYYTPSVGAAPVNFPFDDQPNAPIQIFGDAANGDFDNRGAQPTVFVREPGFLFDSSTLADSGSSLAGDIATFLLNNRRDDDIVDNDATVASAAPYTGMSYMRFATDQLRNIGGVDFPFRRIIDANGATIEQAYSYAQYLLRQPTDIDGGAGTEIGQTAESFGVFNGSTFIGGEGVFFDNLATASQSQMRLTDQGAANTGIQFPSVAGGANVFTPNLADGGTGRYSLFYTAPPVGDPYGGADPVLVEDASGDPITGAITAESIPFDFAFTQNTQAGYAGGTTRAVTLVGVNPGKAKFQRFDGVLIDSTTLQFGLVAQDDTAHEDFAA